MKALRVTADGVRTGALPDPRPGPDEVLVRVAYAGICPTDRRLAARPRAEPRIPGHELSGLLCDGTAVGVHPDIGCGRCSACRAGWDNRCPDRVALGLDRDGGFAELVAVPARHVVPLHGVALEHGPLLEPLACCLQAVDLLQVRSGETTLVVGAGPMGVLCMWALQAAGARVAVTQRSAARRALASRLGADAVLDPRDDLGQALGDAPVAVAVAAPGAAALEYALRTVAPGGRVHAFAGTPGGAPVDANLVHYRHLTLTGSSGSRLADYQHACDLAAMGRVDLARLPRTIVPLDDAAGRLTEPPGAAFKLLIQPGEESV
jgi:threonine dehydrogenase-like Zn-dependent dehydrogenase